MADLLWDDVKWFFDPVDMGTRRDAFVPDASVEDWQAVLDLAVDQGWAFEYSEGESVLPLPRAEVVLSRPADAEQPHLDVWPTARSFGRSSGAQTPAAGVTRQPKPALRVVSRQVV